MAEVASDNLDGSVSGICGRKVRRHVRCGRKEIGVLRFILVLMAYTRVLSSGFI